MHGIDQERSRGIRLIRESQVGLRVSSSMFGYMTSMDNFQPLYGRFIAGKDYMKPGKQRLGGYLSLSVTVVLIAAFSSSSAHAQQGFGVRAGVSAQPEQFYFGGHATLGPVVEKLYFRPNLEVGVGNGATLVALNAEFTYWVPLRKNPWNVYLGGGPAANIFTSGSFGNRNTDAGPGFNFLVGLAQRRGLFTEIKMGAIDSPSFKFGIGYTFQ